MSNLMLFILLSIYKQASKNRISKLVVMEYRGLKLVYFIITIYWLPVIINLVPSASFRYKR